MPFVWRVGLLAGIVAVGGLSYLLRDVVGVRGQAVAGVLCFFGIVAAFSQNLRAVNWRTIGFGFGLQIILAVLELKVPIVYSAVEAVGGVFKKFIGFSDKGAEFVFGNLARPGDIALNPKAEFLFIFAFKALPPILNKTKYAMTIRTKLRPTLLTNASSWSTSLFSVCRMPEIVAGFW